MFSINFCMMYKEEVMSILFTSKSIGPVGMKNRFICAACEGNLANEEGMVTDKLVEKMRSMAQGGAGLIISSHMAVHPYGRTRMFQPGIYNDGLISGLKTLADVIHENGSKAVFQLGHAGLQTKKEVINHVPIGPTGKGYIMTDNDINEIIQAFARASERAAEAGAAGVQIHAAHGYLINEFLSPYYNEREDQWGVTEEGRFRFLGEIISAVKKVLPESMALMVKLNTNDYTPRPGVSPDMAGRYAERLFKLGVHAIEASCGTSLLSPWNMCKGSIPINDIIETLPDEKKERMKIYLSIMKDKCSLTEGYNAEALREIRKH